MTIKPTKIAVLATLAAISISLPSCLKHKEEEYVLTQNLTNYYNYVIDQSTGSASYYSNVSYNITYNYTKSIADLKITGFQLPGVQSYPVLNFEQVPFTMGASGWKTISIKDYIPSGSGSFAQAPTFNNVSFKLIDRTIQDAYCPVTSISFNVAALYTVYSLPLQVFEMPQVTVKDAAGDEFKVIEDEAPLYVVTFDPAKQKANLKIRGAKFASAMPALNMQFDGIDFQVTSQGTVILSAESLIPDLLTGGGSTPAATPAPNFPITNLTGTFDPAKGLVFDFTCTVKMSEQAPAMPYSVHAVSTYPSESSFE